MNSPQGCSNDVVLELNDDMTQDLANFEAAQSIDRPQSNEQQSRTQRLPAAPDHAVKIASTNDDIANPGELISNGDISTRPAEWLQSNERQPGTEQIPTTYCQFSKSLRSSNLKATELNKVEIPRGLFAGTIEIDNPYQ
jgi:hypothetical protein